MATKSNYEKPKAHLGFSAFFLLSVLCQLGGAYPFLQMLFECLMGEEGKAEPLVSKRLISVFEKYHILRLIT